VTLRVTLVMPEGELWAGSAERVIAKTLDGDIGVLTGHSPVLGILSPGSVVRILPQDAAEGNEVTAAVDGGFLSVSDDRVAILARQAMLGGDVDRAAVKAELEAQGAAEADPGPGADEPEQIRYLRGLLRVAGDRN
jgi:F-type H+-transporting ATPase subunit epsilon